LEKSNHYNTRILVVDDDRDAAEKLVAHLSRLGYPATAVCSGKEALAVFGPGRFHLVLSELKLPDIDGIALLDALKRRDKRVVFIMVASQGTIDDAVQALHKGAYDVITKPLNMNDIALLLRRGTGHYALSAKLHNYRKYALILAASLPLWLLLGFWAVRLW
jgi:DNA-binding NtrC family response regulator